VPAHGDILFATEHGYGKKVDVNDFRVAHRGGMGVRTIPTDERNGQVIGLAIVSEESEILLIDKAGKIIRVAASEIRAMGRQAKGVRLIRLDEEQVLASLVAFTQQDVGDEGNGSGQNNNVSTPMTAATKLSAGEDFFHDFDERADDEEAAQFEDKTEDEAKYDV
jgi:DNA gyrase subunit A